MNVKYNIYIYYSYIFSSLKTVIYNTNVNIKFQYILQAKES